MDHGYLEDYIEAGLPIEWLERRCQMVYKDWGIGQYSMQSYRHHGISYDIWTLKIAPKEFRFFGKKEEVQAARVLHSLEDTAAEGRRANFSPVIRPEAVVKVVGV